MTMERSIYLRAGYWLGLLGPVVLAVMVISAFRHDGGNANVAGYGAVFLGIVGTGVLGVAWLLVMVFTRAWLASVMGAGSGLVLMVLVLIGYSWMGERTRSQAMAQQRSEQAVERHRLLQAVEAARRHDAAAIGHALAEPTAYNNVESMCALVATPSTSLSSVLSDTEMPEVLHATSGRGIETDVLMQIATVMIHGQDDPATKQQVLYELLQSLDGRDQGPPQFPAWRALWEQVERQAGVAPVWPPRLLPSANRSYREYCGGGNDERLAESIDRMTAAQAPQAETITPPLP